MRNKIEFVMWMVVTVLVTGIVVYDINHPTLPNIVLAIGSVMIWMYPTVSMFYRVFIPSKKELVEFEETIMD